MITLHDYGILHGSDKATHHNYCGFYQTHLNDPKVILEFGVLNGASLKMWRDFYAGSLVIGLDIEPKPIIEGCLIYQADATNPSSVAIVTKLTPSFDLIVDDASHNSKDQIAAFELWWPLINRGGRYVLEDLHTMHYTSYNPDGIDMKKWVESLGIPHKYFNRVSGDESDSMTLIFFKD